MKTILRLVLGCLVALPLAFGSLRTAREAQAVLGETIWSRVIRIENNRSNPTYPPTVYATIFEFAGVLWFYTDTDGTQSFSLHQGRLEAEKANFATLVQAIDPGFISHEILPNVPASRTSASFRLPNGCFIDSLVALRAAVARGEGVVHASLLAYYRKKGAGVVGHTVLAYETKAGFFVVDSAKTDEAVRIGAGWLSGDPRKVAGLVSPFAVASARWIPLPIDGAGVQLAHVASEPLPKRAG